MLPSLSPEGNPVESTTDQRFDLVSLAREVGVTYTAAGHKTLAARVGLKGPSHLYRQHDMLGPDELLEDERARTRKINPLHLLCMATKLARKDGAPEHQAAAWLFEACRQLGYEPPILRGSRITGSLETEALDLGAQVGQLQGRIADALSDGTVDAEEARQVRQALRGVADHTKTASAALDARVREDGQRGASAHGNNGVEVSAS